MLAILSAMLVMTESGSAPATRLDLAVDPPALMARLDMARLAESAEPGPPRHARTLSDCNPRVVGLEAGDDRLATSQDLLVCRATLLKDEPVGKAVLWIRGETGLQADLSASRVHLRIRFNP